MTVEALELHKPLIERRGRPRVPREPCPECGGHKSRTATTCKACTRVPRAPCPSCGGVKAPMAAKCRACFGRAKYGETRFALRTLAATEPDLNLSEAADRLGVTRERVRQLANQDNLPLRRGRRPKQHPKCLYCGEAVLNSIQTQPSHAKCKPKLYCVACGGEIYIPPTRREFMQDGRPRKLAIRHRKCHLATPPAICPVCEKRYEPDFSQRARLRGGNRVACNKCKPEWKQRLAAHARKERA